MATIILVAAIFAIVLSLSIDSVVAQNVKAAVCRIVSLGKATCPTTGQAGQGKQSDKELADIWPQWCVSSRDKKTLGASIHMGIFDLGSELQYVREDSFEEGLKTDPGLDKNGLGHFVYFSFIPQGQKDAATAKFGGSLNLGGVKLGTELSIGGGVNYHAGDVYRLPAADADKFIKKIKDWESYQADRKIQLGNSPFLMFFANVIAPHTGLAPKKPKIPDPIITFKNSDASVNVKGGVTTPTPPESTLDKSAKYTTGGGLQINAKFDGEHEVEHRYIWTNPDGSVDPVTGNWYAVTGSISGQANIGANIGPAKGGYSHDSSLQFKNNMRVFRYDHDGIHNGVPHKAGDLRDVRFVLTTWSKNGNGLNASGKKNSGGGGVENYKVTTRNLEIDTNSPESRKIVEDYLKNRWSRLKFPDFMYEELWNGTVKDPGPSGDPFDKLAYDTGMGWRETADATDTNYSYGFDISDGLGIGFQMDYSHLKQETMKAEILDHPSNGQRSYINFPQCTAARNH
ncbi:MAG: hypothetical protein JWN52_3221 [Actinomycetia bacterium]|nr:hypothetical protein [Actinomycetes bacterium]